MSALASHFGYVDPAWFDDDTCRLKKALESGSSRVDLGGRTYGVTESVIVPEGVEVGNGVIQMLTPGMNGALVEHGVAMRRLTVIGTGTPDIVERAIYPNVDDVTGLDLDVTVKNTNYCIQIEPLGGSECRHNRITLRCKDALRYGLLSQRASDGVYTVFGRDTVRHDYYCSAGASRNIVNVVSVGCRGRAATMQAYDYQPACVGNDITVRAIGMNAIPGEIPSGAAGINQNCHQNTLRVWGESDGNADYLCNVEGMGTLAGPHPTDNVVHVSGRGIFKQFAACLFKNADSTIIYPNITGRGTDAILQVTQSGSSPHVPRAMCIVKGGVLDGVDGTLGDSETPPNLVRGIAFGAHPAPVYLEDGIVFANVTSETTGL